MRNDYPENLRYYNQFVIGPSYIDNLKLWDKIQIDKNVFLTKHPDLNVSQIEDREKSITLLGYILDPFIPKDNDQEILKRLLKEFQNHDNLIKNTYMYGGRWILILKDRNGIKLIHDAFGLRQVFYTDIYKTKDLWCASQPSIIAERLNLGMDFEAVNYVNSISKKDKEYWWPGDSSPYKEIKHLLPNHYLDFQLGQCKRYWPEANLSKISLEIAVENISVIITGLMKSACNRYDMALAITAGWDSRLVLASAKDIRDRISYFTTKQMNMSNDHADLTVPSILLTQFNLKHNVLSKTNNLNKNFLSIYNKNVPFAHYAWAADAQVEYEYNKKKKVAVTGSVSEVARNFYGLHERQDQISGEILSNLCKMGKNSFAVGHFNNWLEGIRCNLYNYYLLDLLYWEQRSGKWLAMGQLEFDIAWKDIFTPYNCRNLIMNMLSVDIENRIPPKYKLYERLILNLWPELFQVPINPHKETKPISDNKDQKYLKIKLKKYLRTLWKT